MAQLSKLDVYCATIKRGQYENIRALHGFDQSAIDISRIDASILTGVEARMRLSLEFLQFATALLAMPIAGAEINFRNAVSRGYYSIHHALRAVLLFRDRGDTEGHSAADHRVQGAGWERRVDPSETRRRHEKNCTLNSGKW